MHIFVSGGTGYIGSVLVPHLVERGHKVTVLDRFYFGNTLKELAEAKPASVQVIHGDTRSFDPKLLAGVDAVIDLAGISNDPACELDAALTRSINVDGGRRLAELAQKAGIRRYVYSSSCSVYGHGETKGLTETSHPNPVSLYAHAKRELEEALLDLGAQSKGSFEPVILRLATVFGVSPRMRFDLAINIMTKNAYMAHRIVVDGGGRQWRPFVHVGDVAAAFALACESEARLVAGQTFNVGSTACNVQILNLAFRVRELIASTEVVHSPTDPDLRDYNVAFEKIEQTLDYRAKVTIEDGVAEVLNALKIGALDPDERRWYTLRHYRFLVDAEQVMRDIGISGRLLST